MSVLSWWLGRWSRWWSAPPPAEYMVDRELAGHSRHPGWWWSSFQPETTPSQLRSNGMRWSRLSRTTTALCSTVTSQATKTDRRRPSAGGGGRPASYAGALRLPAARPPDGREQDMRLAPKSRPGGASGCRPGGVEHSAAHGEQTGEQGGELPLPTVPHPAGVLVLVIPPFDPRVVPHLPLPTSWMRRCGTRAG